MKNLFSWKFAVGLALLAVWAWPAVAQTQTLRTHVPFPFVAGGQQFGAGDYLLTLNSEKVSGSISAVNTYEACFVPLVPGSEYRSAANAERGMLRFAKYGSHYVLTGIWRPGEVEGKTVAGSGPPKEYSKAMIPTEVVELR